jgi:hypothetical protein
MRPRFTAYGSAPPSFKRCFAIIFAMEARQSKDGSVFRLN